MEQEFERQEKLNLEAIKNMEAIVQGKDDQDDDESDMFDDDKLSQEFDEEEEVDGDAY